MDTEDIWSDMSPIEGDNDDFDYGYDYDIGGDGGDGGDWVLNEYGDKFRRQPLPPVHPDLTLLPSPSSLFPEITDISSFLKPPTYEPFPDSRLRDIISDPPADETPPDPERFPKLPEDAFYHTWTPPTEWDAPKGEVREVQWEGFKSGRGDWESQEEKEVRLERKEAVRKGFVWAWQKYKDHAWGQSSLVSVTALE
jgi:mannosyl-oligosaccharide alpha-1,2-mannosidase